MKTIIYCVLLLALVASNHALKRRRMADESCYHMTGDSCKDVAESSDCSTFNYPSGNCASKGYTLKCEARYNIVYNYKPADCQKCADMQKHALGSVHVKCPARRLADSCYMISSSGTCKNAAEPGTCTTFPDTYKAGTCESKGYPVPCKLRYDIV